MTDTPQNEWAALVEGAGADLAEQAKEMGYELVPVAEIEKLRAIQRRIREVLGGTLTPGLYQDDVARYILDGQGVVTDNIVAPEPEQTLEDRAQLVNRYWPRVYRVASRFILRDWDDDIDKPAEQCPTCGKPYPRRKGLTWPRRLIWWRS